MFCYVLNDISKKRELLVLLLLYIAALCPLYSMSILCSTKAWFKIVISCGNIHFYFYVCYSASVYR